MSAAVALGPPAAQGKPDAETEALARKLKDPSDRERREAVQALAKLGSPAAWELVLDTLKDPAPMVADEAQLALGDIDDAAVLKDLFGKKGLASGEEWVALRAAEALGRMKIPVDSGALGKHLSAKSPELRRTLAWSAERLARAKMLDDKALKYLQTTLEALRKKDKDADVRAAVVLAEYAVGAPQGANLVLEGLEEKAVSVQCATVQIERERDPVKALEAFGSWAYSPELPVRRELVEVLVRVGTRASMRTLAGMLEREKNVRLAWTIVERLQDLSGLKNQLNPPFWKDWAEKLAADWKPGLPTSAAPVRDYGTPTTVFVGQPVLSSRVAILIDFSGSLWEKQASGKTRKELIDVEVRRTLEALPPETQFNLIPYTAAPFPWEKHLVPATPANVKKALAFFEGCKESGKGNFWDAVLLAFDDKEVDTILVLTDGSPTGGHRWNLPLMGELFAEHNRFRHIVLDAVLVDAKPFIQEQWTKMCASSGGRMLPIELK